MYKRQGLCCHCVAILLKYISRRHIQTSFPSKKQNRIGQTLIESYIHQSSGSHYPAEASETKVLIELEPILHKQYHKLSVDFKIGTGKKYVIKDLLEFARLIRQGELFQYGKNLKFFHEPAAFTSESRSMLAGSYTHLDVYKRQFLYRTSIHTANSQPITIHLKLHISPGKINAIHSLRIILISRSRILCQYTKQCLSFVRRKT